MVLSNIDLEHTVKNGFRKCDLYSLNPETFAIEHEINTEIKTTEFDIAIDIINKIASRLCERGIDSDIVVEEVCELKQVKKDRSIEILGNLTIQFGMYVISEGGILKMQMKYILEPNLPSSPDDLVPKRPQVQYLLLNGGNI